MRHFFTLLDWIYQAAERDQGKERRFWRGNAL
jgi:hypothetical protein